jgi:hypothetical protein
MLANQLHTVNQVPRSGDAEVDDCVFGVRNDLVRFALIPQHNSITSRSSNSHCLCYISLPDSPYKE